MKKNFLNAILFGGLIALSAGSFVACSDYDDDINGLQEQIDSVNATLAALQAQVDAGRWVTTLTKTDAGFTVVFSDGSTYDIKNGQDGAAGTAGEAGAAGSVLTIGDDGYWYIDGVTTGYKAEIDTNQMSYVDEDGYWNIGGEKTTYKAVGNTYAVKDDDGVWTLYVPGQDGTIQKVELPSAAAKITSIKVIDATGYDKYLSLDNSTFTYSGSWDGGKKLPESNSRIIASSNKVLLQITPAEAASNIQKITLVNSKGEALGIDLKAEAYTGLLTRADAANGLYELSVPAQAVTTEEYKAIEKALTPEDETNAMFGFAADGVLRSGYDYATSEDGKTGNNSIGTELEGIEYSTDGLYIKPLSGETTIEFGSEEASSIGTVKTGVANTIGFSKSYIYDAYLTFDEEDIEAFGIVYDKEKAPLTFTVGKAAGLTVDFTLTTIDVLGTVKTTALSASIAVEGADVTIKDEDSTTIDFISEDGNSYIDIDLAKFNINTDFWKNNCATVVYDGLYSDAACTKAVTDNGGINNVNPSFYTADGDKTTAAKDATKLSVFVGYMNSTPKVKADTQYYLKLVSKSSESTGSVEIGTIVVPVQFKVDENNSGNTIERLIKQNLKGTYEEAQDGALTIKGYNIDVSNNYYGINLCDYINNLASTVYMSEKYVPRKDLSPVTIDGTAIKLTLDSEDKTAIDNIRTSKDVAGFHDGLVSGQVWLALRNDNIASDGKSMPVVTGEGDIQAGYGKDLIIKAETLDGSESYSFKVRIESPIASGEVKLTGEVTLSRSDLMSDGEYDDITSDEIKGYNANEAWPFDLFETENRTTGTTSIREHINGVSYKGATYLDYMVGNDTGIVIQNGEQFAPGRIWFKRKGGVTIPEGGVTDTITVTVEDTYGYTRSWDVEVTIK